MMNFTHTPRFLSVRKSRTAPKYTLIALCMAWACTSSQAVNIDTETLNRLSTTAQTKGSVPVHILLTTATLDDLAQHTDDILAKTKAKADTLIASLGVNALPEGRHINPMGSMDLLVTTQGLELLRESSIALSVHEGDEWHRNILLPDLDGSLAAIDADLDKRGFSIVNITLDVDGAEYDVDRQNGQSKLQLKDQALQNAAQKKANVVLSTLGLTPSIQGKTTTADGRLNLVDDSTVTTHGHFTLKVDRRALFDLARNPYILAIKPIGHRPPPYPVTIDPLALDAARKDGWADVLVQLRLPYVSGQSTETTREAHTRSHQRMLDDVLAGIQPKNPPQSFARLGGLNAKLSLGDLEKLARNKDARLLGVSLNRPLFKPSLLTSMASMNLSGTTGQWSKGYKGAGQTIIVMDTGIEKNHAMFKRADGTSKVWLEACFQTDLTVSLFTSYQSKCPSRNINGDSVITGAGDPLSEVICDIDPIFKQRYCSHGTHVASIAAGHYSTKMSPQLQGVAPEANLISINIYTPVITPPLFGNPAFISGLAFPSDFITAIQLIDQFIPLTGSSQPYTVNMSLGGSATGNPTDCWLNTDPTICSHPPSTVATYSFQAAVVNLRGKGVPVIAAMGNDNIIDATGNSSLNNNSKMHIPAAVPGVIKVGAVDKNLPGTTMAAYSNRVKPELWPNEDIFLAPGGLTNNGINAAAAYGNGTGTAIIEGTSMATPHISGVFAIIKSVVPSASIKDILDFIKASSNRMTYSVTAIACDPNNSNSCTTTSTFKALRFCYGSSNNTTCP